MIIQPQLTGPVVACVFNASAATPETNLTAGARGGSTVTANATPHTVGTYTELIASTTVATSGIYVFASEVATNNTNTSQLLNIATGGAGSETVIIPNIDIGGAAGNIDNEQAYRWYYFPGIAIPSTTRISANLQAVIGGDTAVIGVILDGIAYNFSASAAIAYGADTANSRGTSVTPNSAHGRFTGGGAWTSIGTTSAAHNAFIVGLDLLGDTSVTVDFTWVEIGYGATAAAVKSLGFIQHSANIAEDIIGCFPPVIFKSLPSGTALWARVYANEATARGVIIHGI